MSILRAIFSGLLLTLLVLLILLSGCHDEAESKPTIISLSPDKAPVGKLVTITGTNFNGVSLSDNIVEFNGVSANVSNSTATTIKVKVPNGATTGKVSVTIRGKGKTQSPSDFIVDDCSTCGFVEKFALSNYNNYSIEPISDNRIEYERSVNKRGFNFFVKKKLRVKAIGGFFRKAGSYPMELISIYDYFHPIYATTISVNDTENFVFQDVDTDLQLIPGVQYTLRYCSENHDSVYDMFSVSGSSSSLIGFDFGDVRLDFLSCSYIRDCSEIGDLSGWGTGALSMRGIVDFKYEIVE